MVQQRKLQSFSRRCVTLFFPPLILEKIVECDEYYEILNRNTNHFTIMKY